ncbi:MAG: hypothetical protein JW832_06480 [Deltaproteobacteria bacterium]|nr:hypothetical protein [Deltaproteobacteria bacterium]
MLRSVLGKSMHYFPFQLITQYMLRPGDHVQKRFDSVGKRQTVENVCVLVVIGSSCCILQGDKCNAREPLIFRRAVNPVDFGAHGGQSGNSLNCLVRFVIKPKNIISWREYM